jgi:hypothetical protein
MLLANRLEGALEFMEWACTGINVASELKPAGTISDFRPPGGGETTDRVRAGAVLLELMLLAPVKASTTGELRMAPADFDLIGLVLLFTFLSGSLTTKSGAYVTRFGSTSPGSLRDGEADLFLLFTTKFGITWD